jgi:hypothetical protein
MTGEPGLQLGRGVPAALPDGDYQMQPTPKKGTNVQLR